MMSIESVEEIDEWSLTSDQVWGLETIILFDLFLLMNLYLNVSGKKILLLKKQQHFSCLTSIWTCWN